MKTNKYLVSHTNYEIVNQNDEVIGYRVARDFFKVETLLKSCDIGLSTVMIEKEKILQEILVLQNLKLKKTFILWLKILKKGKLNIYGLKLPLTQWRKLKDSLSSSSIQKLKDGFRVYNLYMKFNIIKSLYFLLILSFNF